MTHLDDVVRKFWSKEVQQLTEQQVRWVQWQESRFAHTLHVAKSQYPSNMLTQLARIELIEHMSRFVDYAAHGVGLVCLTDGSLRLKLPVIFFEGSLGRTITKEKIRAGNDTAEFMLGLLAPYLSPEYLPEDIQIVAERYANSATWVKEEDLEQYDFDYRVIIPFPA